MCLWGGVFVGVMPESLVWNWVGSVSWVARKCVCNPGFSLWLLGKVGLKPAFWVDTRFVLYVVTDSLEGWNVDLIAMRVA